ncbi:HEPN domain-containing protein [Beijerinckia sp. L45]|uniref:HEPN domain-containing protein n=1 Tax=Beijerinckia sp. L45 TaxID=1641855 RepID=UPI00131BE5B5|nr:HEPN domain-containing protein [Beijerinckia sp. L45]
MKSHLSLALGTFQSGCTRAEGLCAIFHHLRRTAPAAMDCDDILRSAVVLAVSSFDLFIHDLFRLEVIHRIRTGKKVDIFKVPFNVLLQRDLERIESIEACIREDNSYKSFVAPDKLASCLRPLVNDPWEKISSCLVRTSSVAKAELKRVVDLRNRIAHEADLNPALGGVELWPIYREDVETSVEFLRRLGAAIAKVLDDA